MFFSGSQVFWVGFYDSFLLPVVVLMCCWPVWVGCCVLVTVRLLLVLLGS